MQTSSLVLKSPLQSLIHPTSITRCLFSTCGHLPLSFPTPITGHRSSPIIIRKRYLPPPALSSFLDEEGAVVEEEDEHVIGDCLVFEEGAFEDPYIDAGLDKITANKKISKKKKLVKEENLVPEEWKEAQIQMNLSKKQRREIAQQLQFGRRVERKLNPVVLPNMADYFALRALKLSQLNPVVLDDPKHFPNCEKTSEAMSSDRAAGQIDSETVGSDSSSRVAPRNPRLRIADGGLEDISRFFNSSDYSPEERGANPEGRRRLFTKEEKVLLNTRVPNLANATSTKWLPLHSMVAAGEFFLVDKLRKHYVDINATDKDGLTALHRAILSKKQAIISYLLRESANPFVRDKEGATLMHYAVLAASSPAIKLLLLYNADINLADDDGWTPLHLAVQTQRTDVVKLLLIKGADKTLKNQEGLTPIEMCLYSGRSVRTYELIKLFKEVEKPQ